MTVDDETVPLLLKVARARKGHHQGEAAAEMGVSRGQLWRWETNISLEESTVTLSSLRKIAAYTGRTVEEVAARIPHTPKEREHETA